MKKNNIPTISVLIPVWNGLPFIRETIESVLSQDFTDWELIISDNCSTDGTREFLDSLRDSRIRVLKQETNRGIFGNLNVLFREATSEFSQILCADDYLLPGGLGRVVETWNTQDGQTSFIRFNFGELRNADVVSRLSYRQYRGAVLPENSDLMFYVFGNLPGNLSNVSVRTGRVIEAGFFREDLPYAGDFEMWSRMGTRWPFLITEHEVSVVRRHSGVASNYLNQSGELVTQLGEITSNLYRRLRPKHSNLALRLQATANYDTLQRDVGVRRVLQSEGFRYLREVDFVGMTHPAIFKFPFNWVVYFLTGGGRWGRDWVALWLLGGISGGR